MFLDHPHMISKEYGESNSLVFRERLFLYDKIIKENNQFEFL